MLLSDPVAVRVLNYLTLFSDYTCKSPLTYKQLSLEIKELSKELTSSLSIHGHYETVEQKLLNQKLKNACKEFLVLAPVYLKYYGEIYEKKH